MSRKMKEKNVFVVHGNSRSILVCCWLSFNGIELKSRWWWDSSRIFSSFNSRPIDSTERLDHSVRPLNTTHSLRSCVLQSHPAERYLCRRFMNFWIVCTSFLCWNSNEKIIIRETPELLWVIADFFASFFFPVLATQRFDCMVKKSARNSCQMWGTHSNKARNGLRKQKGKISSKKNSRYMKSVWTTENIHKFARNRRDVVVLLMRECSLANINIMRIV